VYVSGPVDAGAPPIPVTDQFEVPLLACESVLDQPDPVPGVEPRVERSEAGRLRGRRQVEPEEPKRDVQQAATARGLGMHQAGSRSRGVGRSRQLAARAAA
jgi:hypothetical protein